MMESLPYPIHIGLDCLKDLPALLTKYSQVVVLVDSNTYSFCYPKLLPFLPENHLFIGIYAGEAHKSLSTCEKVWTKLIEYHCDRNIVIINLGGGFLGDIGGFIAGVFKRGVDFIQIPTTLLAMTDASVGAKVGINFMTLKNTLGLFQDPQAVFICPDFLTTLPKREWMAGYAEVAKHYLIADKKGWNAMKTRKPWEGEILDCIHHSVRIKSKIVLQDKRDEGLRQILNFGHTFGHAIESYVLAFDNEGILHGEAVAAGMICELYLSSKKKRFKKEEMEAICHYLFQYFNLPAIPPFCHRDLVGKMRADKKNTGTAIRCVLLSAVGKPHFGQVVTEAEALDALLFYHEYLYNHIVCH